MDNKKDIIGHSLKERGARFKMPVDEALWDKIAAGLPPKRTTVAKKWWVASAAAAVLIVAVWIGKGLIEGEVGMLAPTAATQDAPAVIPENRLPEPIAEASEGVKTKPSAAPATKFVSAEKTTVAPETAPPRAVVPDERYEQEEREQEQEQEPRREESKQPPPSPEERKKQEEKFVAAGQTPDWQVGKAPEKKKKTRKMSFALAMGNQNASFSPAQTVTPTVNEAIPTKSTVEGMTSSSNVVDLTNIFSANLKLANEGDLSDPQPSTSEYDYKMPIALSLLVRKHLTDRWALESGITYTRLASVERFTASSLSKEVELDYIGIPLKVAYSIYQNDRLSIYLATGGMLEKSIRGKETDFFSEEQRGEAQDLKVSERQYSVMGNLGIHYRLFQRFGLFVEPGVQYYFNDGSSVQTIRKDKPLNVGVQAGIRLIY